MKEVKRHAKVGEYIKIVKCDDVLKHGYENGDIFEVIKLDLDKIGVWCVSTRYDCGVHGWCIGHSEYIVLEDYNPNEIKQTKIVVDKINTEEIESNIVIPDDEVCKYFLGGLHNLMLDDDTLDYVRTDINLCKQYDEIFNKEREEKDMNKVLKLYYDRKREEINKKYEEKVDNDFNNIDVVKQYKTLIENFEKEQEALFKTVENFDNDYLVPSYDSNLYKYSISELKTRSSLMTAYENDRVNEIEKLKELVEEVDAQLSLSDDLNYQMEVLTRYDILDKKTNKVKA